MTNELNRSYDIFGVAFELELGEQFVEHYVLAFDIARTIEATELNGLSNAIKAEVIEALGPNISLAEVLVVSYLAAEARNKILRRPLERHRKELNRVRRRLWLPFNIKAARQEHELLGGQVSMFREQAKCTEAQAGYLKELSALIEGNISVSA